MIQGRDPYVKTRFGTTLEAEILVVFIFVVCLGFPGLYSLIIGNAIGKLFEYVSFALQIALMLFYGRTSLLEIRILDLKERYLPLYQFIAVQFAVSMLGTSSKSEQLITSVRLSVTILFAIWLAEQFQVRRLITLFSYAHLIVDAASLFFVVIRPSSAFISGDTYTHALRGIQTSKNSFGSALAFGSILFALEIMFRIKEQKTILHWVLAFCLHFVLLLAAQTTAAQLITMAVSLYLVLLNLFPIRRLNLGLWYVVISVGFLFFVFTFLPFCEPLLELIGKDVTLTGRTILWDGIYRFVQERNMLTGFGFGHFWEDSKAVARLHYQFPQYSFFATMKTGAHNLILELWLNIGLIGITSYLASVALSFRGVLRMSLEMYATVSALLLYFCICGLTERLFSGAYAYPILTMFLLEAIACRSKVLLAEESL